MFNRLFIVDQRSGRKPGRFVFSMIKPVRAALVLTIPVLRNSLLSIPLPVAEAPSMVDNNREHYRDKPVQRWKGYV